MPINKNPELRQRSDSTKKRAPVDTVRLKQDLQKDMHNSARMNNEMLKHVGTGSSAERFLRESTERTEASARARGDTLEKARQGKIPAKKTPKKR